MDDRHRTEPADAADGSRRDQVADPHRRARFADFANLVPGLERHLDVAELREEWHSTSPTAARIPDDVPVQPRSGPTEAPSTTADIDEFIGSMPGFGTSTDFEALRDEWAR